MSRLKVDKEIQVEWLNIMVEAEWLNKSIGRSRMVDADWLRPIRQIKLMRPMV